MAEKHTPTPWKFSPWHIEEGPSAVRSPAGWIVATTAGDADAAFIVRAVNSHDKLVEALRQMVVNSEADGKSYRDCHKKAVAALASLQTGEEGSDA